MDGAYRHRALFYRDDAEFVEGTEPFIRAGVDAGEPVLVAVDERKIGMLTARLGPRAERVRFLEMTGLGRNPARIIPVWRDFVAEAGGRPARGIGEPVWPGRTPDELAECDRHESLLNAAFEGVPRGPFELLCPYDAATLPAHVLAAARRNHPEVVDGDDPAPSDAYRGPHEVDPFGGELPPPPERAAWIGFSGQVFPEVRDFARACARDAGLDERAQEDFLLAINELAANSIVHGGGRGSVAIWEEPGALVCEVEDAGRFTDPLAGRRRPGCDQDSGRGLWVVNQVCDLVQIRSGPRGNFVRVRMATAGARR